MPVGPARERDPVSPASLRERKKRATRRALAEAAVQLATRRGLDNLLVGEIAAEANVSPRTFNNYFSSKLEAVFALATERTQRIGDSLRQRPPQEPLWEALTKAVLEHYRGGESAFDADSMARLRSFVRSPAVQGEYLRVSASMQRTLALAIAERTGSDIDQDMLPMVVAGAVTAATQVAVLRWLDAEPPRPLLPLLQQALQQLARAI